MYILKFCPIIEYILYSLLRNNSQSSYMAKN